MEITSFYFQRLVPFYFPRCGNISSAEVSKPILRASDVGGTILLDLYQQPAWRWKTNWWISLRRCGTNYSHCLTPTPWNRGPSLWSSCSLVSRSTDTTYSYQRLTSRLFGQLIMLSIKSRLIFLIGFLQRLSPLVVFLFTMTKLSKKKEEEANPHKTADKLVDLFLIVSWCRFSWPPFFFHWGAGLVRFETVCFYTLAILVNQIQNKGG